MNRRTRALALLLALGAWTALYPAGAAAHDFKVGFLVPLSGADAESGRESVRAFKLAAAERDGHADEEADGHLGGLDVYLLTVDTAQGRDAALARLRTLLREPGLHFVTGALPADWMPALEALLAEGPALLVDPARIAAPDTRTMDGEPFDRAYVRLHGNPPGTAGKTAYAAARMLDRAVRDTGDDFSRRERTRAALGRAGYR